MSAGIALCPMCGRGVRTKNGRYQAHSKHAGHRNTCRMSTQNVPIVGVTDVDYEERARIVAELAVRVQDEDPSLVWDYLTALPADELQRLTMITLAGLNVDQTLTEMFAWVTELPAAQLNPEEATA